MPSIESVRHILEPSLPGMMGGRIVGLSPERPGATTVLVNCASRATSGELRRASGRCENAR